jgi:putative Mg2+ transporter-C (MgtC) family protein
MDLTIPLKLILAAMLGGIIGLERELRKKPAGLRTNILICVGSTLLMSISTNVARTYGGDPTRIAAQIITGIGFLGAGAVMHSHGSVLGLTTAATIWVVAGVGMALGSGMYGTAAFTTGMCILTLYFLPYIEDKIRGRKSHSYALTVTDFHQALPAINNALRQCSVSPSSFNFRKNAGSYRVFFQLFASRESNNALLEHLSRIPEVTEVETGSSARDLINGRSQEDEDDEDDSAHGEEP